MRAIFRLLLAPFIFLAASFAGCVLSAQEVIERPVLRAVYGEFYPYGFTGPDGTAQGYAVDVTRRFANMAGYDVAFVPAENPQQFLDMLARGEVDLTPLLALTPQRVDAGLATASLGEYVLSVYVRQDSDIFEPAQLADMRIGAVTGSASQMASEMLSDVDIVEYRTSDAMLLPLLRGEIDALVEVQEPFEARLRRNFIEEKVRRLEPPLVITPYGFILRSELSDVHAAFQEIIGAQGTKDLLQQMRTQWFGKDRSIFEHPWFNKVAMIVGGIALSTVSLGIYAVRLRRRTAVLADEFGTHKLLIDALDQTRAAIAIFDSEMRAVHWNGGFEAQFPQFMGMLEDRASLNELCLAFEQNLASPLDAACGQSLPAMSQTMGMLKGGQKDNRILHLRDGSSFDVSMLPMGARHYAVIWVDMTNFYTQQKLLEAQSAELVFKNLQLQRFSTMAAHDLKAPLAQQGMLLDFLAEDIAEANLSLPPKAAGYLGTLSDLSHKMGLLVSDLLDYAQADQAQGGVVCFSPNARLDDIVKLAAPKSQMKIVIAPDIPEVRVNPTSFDTVMRNLIGNAAKHHDRPTGTITLRGYRDGPLVVIEVEDDGPGIRSADQERVFKPFERLTKVEGSGLGLSFVKQAATAWGGYVEVTSAPVRGTIFKVAVPSALETSGIIERHPALCGPQIQTVARH